MPKIYDIQPAGPEKKKKKSLPVKGEETYEEPVVLGQPEAVKKPLDKEAFLAQLAAKEKREIPQAAEEEPLIFERMADMGWPKLKILIFSAVILTLVLGVWLVGFSLSRAEVELVTEANYLPFSFDLEFRKDVSQPDPVRARYPLEVLKISASSSKEYASGGEGEVKAKAKGFIEVFNEFDTKPQVLVEKTRFLAPDGKLFRITKRITVPGGKMVDGKLVPGSILAEALADQPGSEYNIEPTHFTIPGFQGTPRYEKFYGISREPFLGGAIGKSKFVKDEDIRKAEEDVAKQVFEELKTWVSQSLPETVRLIEGASKIDVKRLEPSAKAGDAVEKFTVKVTADITALVFDEVHVRDKAKEALPRVEKFFLPVLNVSYKPIDAVFKTGILKVRAEGNVNAAESIDALGLKQSLMGKNEAGVKREILTVSGIKEARVKFWPFWVKKMPKNVSRIRLVIK